MKKRLDSSINALKNLRDTHHGQLDNCAVDELNTVITDLETLNGQEKRERREEVGLRALQVMARVISIVSNLDNLMR